MELHPLGPGYDGGRWDERLRAAHNAAFADHFGSAPASAASWVHGRTGSRHFRAACSVAATTADGTGALGVDDRAGFVLHRRDVTYAAPAADGG